jgi:hypothetical protein
VAVIALPGAVAIYERIPGETANPRPEASFLIENLHLRCALEYYVLQDLACFQFVAFSEHQQIFVEPQAVQPVKAREGGFVAAPDGSGQIPQPRTLLACDSKWLPQQALSADWQAHFEVHQ